MWKFNKDIANIFTDHARQHIPNYDLVIDKSIDICNLKSKSSSIIDVGCATGETLSRLHQNEFTNLYGVDNSQDMLDKCPANIATYYHNNSLPQNNYDVVIMNWTLHFIKDKIQYLQSIYQNLNPQGLLILSEKTVAENFPKDFYYNYKRSKGVSDKEILVKENNLKGVMHIDSVSWYLENLKNLGFDQVYIFDAHWCFTSFVAVKK